MIGRLVLMIAALAFVPIPAFSAGKPLTLSLTSATVTEGQAAVLTLSKSGGGRPSLVKWSTSDGSASGTLSGAGTITIPTADDALVNGTRTLTVTATASTGATARGIVTILDNDLPLPPPPPPPSSATWTKCADENQLCPFTGVADVRYGADSTWAVKTAVTGPIGCNNQVFGDPLPNVVKRCETSVASTTPPPPPPPVVCPDGTTLPAGSTCPVVVTPPPSSGAWVAAPLVNGGYGRLTAGFGMPCCTGLIVRLDPGPELAWVNARTDIPLTGRRLWCGHYVTDLPGNYLDDDLAQAVCFWTEQIEGVSPAP